MSRYAKSLLLSITGPLAILAIAMATIGWDRPWPGDENRYIETARQFGQGVNLELLTHYEEMSGPLPFLLFGLWGRLFGYELVPMRMGALLVGLASYVVIHHLLFEILGGIRPVVLTAALILLNPYFITMSMFVYTDMLAVVFGMLACVAVIKSRPLLLWGSITGALLCRQYFVFLVAAIVVYLLIEFARPNRRTTRLLIACGLGTAPLLGLMVLWGGPCPDNELQTNYLDGPFQYHIHSLTLYVCQLSIYMAPLIVVGWRQLYGRASVVVVSLFVSILYPLFPVIPSPVAREADRPWVGMFHRLLQQVIGRVEFEYLVFWLAYAAGLPILWAFGRHVAIKIRDREQDPALLMSLAVLAFLLVMPFSYMHWEKYFMPVFPLACIGLQLIGSQRSEVSNQ